jgi:folate-binding protein YgfZ
MATNSMKETFVAPLAHLGFLRIHGADAETFLQGQLSNDVRLLSDTQAQITSYNSPKGRMLALLHLLRQRDGIVAEIEQSMLEATLKRLRMFVLRSKVTLEDVSPTAPALGLAGLQAVELLQAQSLPAPAHALEAVQHGELRILRRLGETPRFSLHGPAPALAALRERWGADCATGTTQDWRRLDILGGVPTVLPQTSDHFVPQMANLDRLNGISFDKGCYTGQEIVARLHYLGQLKRRMLICRSVASDIAPGSAIYDGDETQAVGEVVQSAPESGGSVLSAVLQLSHAESDQLRLTSPEGARLSRPEA